MHQVLSFQECGNTILIFAQDIAPYDVLDDPSSHALIRQYLDNGGTILWIGDVPFFYRTERGHGNFKLNDFIDRKRSERPSRTGAPHIDVLGVIPLRIVTASRFTITWRGRGYGLRSPWASLRPIIIPSHLQTDRTRISDFFLLRKGCLEIAHVEGVGTPALLPFERKGHIKRLLEFLGTSSPKIGPVRVSSSPKDELLVEFGTKYLSAWIKIFNARFKGSGFIRLWDYSPRIITLDMLQEMSTLLKNYCMGKYSADDTI